MKPTVNGQCSFSLSTCSRCSETSYYTATGNTTGLKLPWSVPQQPKHAKLMFKVKNEGAVKITVIGDSWPKLTAFIGIDTLVNYQGKYTILNGATPFVE